MTTQQPTNFVHPMYNGHGNDLSALLLHNQIADASNHVLNATSSGQKDILLSTHSGTNQIMNVLNDVGANLANSIASSSRVAGTEHGQILNSICDTKGSLSSDMESGFRNAVSNVNSVGYRVCDAEGKLANAITNEGRACTHSILETRAYIDKSICDSTSQIVGNNVSTSNTLRDAVERTGDKVFQGIQDARGDLKDMINLNSTAILTATERNGTANLLSTEKNAGESRAQAERIASENRSNLSGINQNVLLSAKDNLFELCKTENVITRQASDYYSSAMLENFKHKENLSRQLAECCCELKQQGLKESCDIKELIRGTACDLKEKYNEKTNETQLLIRSIESDRVRDALSEEKTRNLVMGLCNHKRCD